MNFLRIRLLIWLLARILKENMCDGKSATKFQKNGMTMIHSYSCKMEIY